MKNRERDAQFIEAIKEMNKKLASKKSVKSTLMECLNDATVKALKYFAKEYDIKGFSKLKKQELAELIYENLIDGEKIKDVIMGISLKELELIKILIKEKTIDVSDVFFKSFIRIVMLGIVYLYNDDNKVKMIMPDEFREIFKNYNFDEVTRVAKFEDTLLKYIIACRNVYGVVDVDFLIHTFNKHTNSKLTANEIIEYFNNNDNCIENVYLIENLLVHEAIISFEGDLEELLNKTKDRKYKELDRNLLLKYADDNFIEMTPAHNEFLNVLNTLFNDEKNANIALEEIVNRLMIDNDANMEELLGIINGFLGMQNIKNEQDLEILIASLINVHNNTRRWINKGFTATELNEKNLTNHTQQRLERKEKIGRNDVCPCGSGKKYKKCCMRK